MVVLVQHVTLANAAKPGTGNSSILNTLNFNWIGRLSSSNEDLYVKHPNIAMARRTSTIKLFLSIYLSRDEAIRELSPIKKGEVSIRLTSSTFLVRNRLFRKGKKILAFLDAADS